MRNPTPSQWVSGAPCFLAAACVALLSCSSTFAANVLVFTGQPTSTVAGSSISPSVQVSVRDGAGNPVTTATDNITIYFGTNPPGGTLSGTLTAAAVAGVATFSNLSIDKTGNGYTLTATATGLTGATSQSFNISAGPPHHLSFTVQPGNALARVAISPAVKVAIQDALGNAVTASSADVTMAIGNNPGGTTLSGTTTVAASAGVATFSDLNIDTAGANYTLTASAGGVSGAASLAFTISYKLFISTQPTNTAAGVYINPAVAVKLQDGLNNTLTSLNKAISIEIKNNPGSGSLSGTTTVNAVNGIVSFANLSIDKTANAYTLRAFASDFTEAITATFNITPGIATKLTFTQQVGSTTAGQALGSIGVAIQDAFGNTVTSASDQVAIDIGTNPGGGTLSGTLTMPAVNGIATFNNLSINKSGAGYTLTATCGSLTAGTSNAFNISYKLIFSVQPSTTLAGDPIAQIEVTIADANDIAIPSASDNITIAISANPGGGILSGTTTVPTSGGVARFSDLSINKKSNGYTLRATATAVLIASAVSSSFNINPNVGTHIVFTAQPPTNTAVLSSMSPSMAVQALDKCENVATGFAGNVTLSIKDNPGGAALSGTPTVTAVSGVATFNNIKLDKPGLNYTLLVSSAGMTDLTTNAFNIKYRLVFGQQPSTVGEGQTMTPPVTVAIQDGPGNPISGATDSIGLTLNSAGGATLSGGGAVNAVGGVATFSNLSVDIAKNGYSLTASASNLFFTVNSSSFNVTNTTRKLKFTASPPSRTLVLAAFSSDLKVAIQDYAGNNITTATDPITLAFANNPSGGTLVGTTTQTPVNGVATFSGLTINLRGSGYTLQATGGNGLVSDTSSAFDIVGKLVFTAQPTQTAAGSPIAAPTGVKVSIEDALGQVITTNANDTITMSANGTLYGTKSVGANQGVATFDTLNIQFSANGYTLTATGSAVNSATSAAFNIVPAAPNKLYFYQSPISRLAGLSLSAAKVKIRDFYNNECPTATNTVTMSVEPNAGGGTLGGTLAVDASNGMATFSDLSIDKAGSTYKLTASSDGLAPATSGSFDINYKMVFLVQPSTTAAGSAITPAVQVAVQDGLNNTIASATNSITVDFGSHPAGSTLLGTKTVAASGGVAVFSDLSITKVGLGYTLTASTSVTPSINTVASTSFDVNMGPPSKLGFSVQPVNTTAGNAISPAVRVQVQDFQGNLVNNASGSVTLGIGTNPSGGTLSGTMTANAINGEAIFNNVSINKVGTGYTLVAHTNGLTDGTSSAFNILVGPAARLGFTVQPVNTPVGSPIAPAVAVAVQDASGNTVPSATNSITVALGNNPSGATLLGTTTHTASSGVATFSDLSINKVGTGYTLSASAAGLTTGTSDAFNAVYRLVFTTPPSAANAGAAISPAVQVSIEDGPGNVINTANDNITVSIGTNPAGGTLSGTQTVAAVSGVATFNDLSINKASAGYTLAAAATGLNGGVSGSFSINPAAPSQLSIVTQPSNALAAVAIAPAVQVAILDTFGNLATSASDIVSVAITGDPVGVTLSGNLNVAAVNGVATFSDLKIDKAGAGYTLAFTSGILTGTTSTPINIAYTLAFSTAPVNTVAGSAITPAVQVSICNGIGGTIGSATDDVTVAIASNPGSGTLSGTATVAAIAGVATFGDLSINRTGTGYTLSATCANANSKTSSSFDITPGPPAALAFTVQPASALAGATLSPAVRVAIVDALGNTVTSASNSVALTLDDPNLAGGALGGTTSRAAVNGVATFNNLSIDKAGLGYTLSASAAGVAGAATSNAFDISYKLVFIAQPSSALARAAISPAIQVEVQDNAGTKITTATDTVTLAIAANPVAGALGGTLSATASSGVATFNDVNIDKAGTGYTLAASAPNVAGATSNTFNISYKLAFTTQPGNTGASSPITPAVQVAVQDAVGNTIASATDNITVAIGANPSAGVLSGTKAVPASSGVATFSNLSINKAGSAYTLTAVAAGMTGATSSAFDITYKLVVTFQPVDTVAGAVISPAVQVAVKDGANATVTSANDLITLAIAYNAGGGTLLGNLSVSAVNGVAIFSDLSIDKTGTGYTLGASATGLAPVTSSGFNITPAAATHLAFAVQPTGAAAGVAIAPAVQVLVQDSFDNTVTSASNAVTMAIGNNPGTGTLGGTVTVNASSGIASFSDLSINKVGSGYTLNAAATSLTGATSMGFDITPGAANRVTFLVQPADAVAGVAITPAVQVVIQDAFGNTVTGSSADVSVAIGTNPGGGTLSGIKTVAASSGIATFGPLSIQKVGTGYTLSAACGSLTSATSAAFSISAGGAVQLGFIALPASAVVNAAISPAVAVAVQDSFGNTVPSATNSISIALDSNPPGATLSGAAPVSASNGVASFSALSINKLGAGFTFRATASGLPDAVSGTFNTTYRLAFTTQPSNAVAGAAITPAVQVVVQDGLNTTIATASDSITLAIANNPNGASLGGVAAASAVNGVATFSGLSLDRNGAGYTLSATAAGLASGVSSAFDITYRLAFTVQPSTTVAGSDIAPAIQVAIRDALGNTVTSATNSVTLSIGTNPSGGVLSASAGTTTVAAVNGVATFSRLGIDKAGSGYTLVASGAAMESATSASFDIIYALRFSVQPASTLAASPITPAVQVAICSASGATVTSASGTITLALGANPGNGTLSGTLSAAAVNGVATFSGIKIDRAGSGYTLVASASGMNSATSGAFDIHYRLAFVKPPSNTLAGSAIAPAVQVAVQDSAGTTITSASGTVTLALGANPGSATLSGTLSQTLVNGVATFSNLALDRCGSAYTLVASATGIDSATSPAFDVTYGLAFVAQPSNAYVGLAVRPVVQVAIRDGLGNTITTATDSITLAIGNNPVSATLRGTVTVAASSGIASFSAISLDKAGTGFTLTATGAGLGGATSNAFNVTTASAPVITSALTLSAIQGSAFSYQITASGSTPLTFSSAKLPAGLTLSGDTISGTPATGGVFDVSVTASNIAGSNRKTLQFTISRPAGTDTPPEISSLSTSDSPTGTTGTAVTFTAAATDGDGDSLSYTWDFGDGTTGTGASTSHVYATPGIYTATVTVFDGTTTTQQQAYYVVSAAEAPVGQDNGGDPTWTAAASNVFSITKVALKFNFVTGAKDTLQLSGAIPLGKFFKPDGKKVSVVIGGFTKDFALNAKGQATAGLCKLQLKGKMKNGVFKATPGTYTLSIKGEPLLTALQEFGFANKTTAKAGEKLDVSMLIMVDTLGYEAEKTLLYKATAKKSGSAK
ncbi:MAG TPA: PKD domain-containing protein [Planctomycetota bacterium]|jgi:hypothetical protein